MGAGKTTVGRLLADALHCPFSDVDHEMQRLDGLPVREIWELKGDAYFADLERQVLLKFLDASPHIIAIGGGTFVRPEIRAIVKARRFGLAQSVLANHHRPH